MHSVPLRLKQPISCNTHPAAAGQVSLHARVAAAVWRGSELGRSHSPVAASGWVALDAELPGGGWPLRSLTEVLAAQPSVLEWRLLAPALRAVVSAGSQVVVISPPLLAPTEN